MEINFPGYTIYNTITKREKKVVCTGKRNKSGGNVVISFSPKISEKFNDLYYEYMILTALEGVTNIHPVEFFEHGDYSVLVTEYFNGTTLNDLFVTKSLSDNDFDLMLEQILHMIEAMHQKNIIHGAISPEHILYNKKEKKAALINYTYSSQISPTTLKPSILHDYRVSSECSPEQVIGSVDFRSDFYQIGMIIFFYCSGDMPFTAENTEQRLLLQHNLSWIQNNIYRSVPEKYAVLLEKLIHPIPSARIDSVHDVLALLETNDAIPEKKTNTSGMGKNSDDKIGNKALSELKLALTRVGKHHGEMWRLLCNDNNYSTLLLQKFITHLYEKNAIVVSSRFLPYEKISPENRIISTLDSLIRIMIERNDADFIHWKHRISKEMTSSMHTLISLLQHFKDVFGKQPHVEDLPLLDHYKRIIYYLKRFVSMFYDFSVPVVMIFRDAQYADTYSLELLKRCLIDNGMNNIMIILSLNEAASTPYNYFAAFWDSIKNQNITQRTLVLPHSQYDKKDEDKEFSEKGNTINRQLTAEQKIILGFLKNIEIPVDVMVLSISFEKSTIHLLKDLLVLAELGYIVILKQRYTVLVSITSHGKDICTEKNNIALISLYAYKNAFENCIEHFNSRDMKDPATWYLLSFINQFFSSSSQKHKIQKLETINKSFLLESVKRDNYGTAYVLISSICVMRSKSHFEKNYNDWLEQNITAVQFAFINRQYEAMDYFLNNITEHSKNLTDTARAVDLLLYRYISDNDYEKVYKTAKEFLTHVGIKIPESVSKYSLFMSFLKIKIKLIFRSRRALENMRPMTDPEAIMAVRIMSRIMPIMYLNDTKNFPLLIFKILELTFRYGMSEVSVFALEAISIMLCGGISHIPQGYSIGKLAIELIQKRGYRKYSAATQSVFDGFIRHWKEPFASSVKSLSATVDKALEIGDYEFAAYAAHLYCSIRFLSGDKLAELDKVFNNYRQLLNDINNKKAISLNSIFHQTVYNLINSPEMPWVLSGPYYNEKEMIPVHIDENDKTVLCDIYCLKMCLAYLFGEQNAAEEYIQMAYQYVDSIISTAFQPWVYYYETLILAKKQHYKTVRNKKYLLKRIDTNIKKFTAWAKHSPDNYSHKLLTMKALAAQLVHDEKHARKLLEDAGNYAQESGNLLDRAIICELLGELFIKQSIDHLALYYLQEAHYIFTEWGALSKLYHFERKYSSYLSQVWKKSINISMTASHRTDHRNINYIMDLQNIMAISQAISEEIIFEKLVEKLMRTMMEHSGAQQTKLLIEQQNVWYLKALQSVDQEKNLKHYNIPLYNLKEGVLKESYELIPVSLLLYAVRTRKPVVLRNQQELYRFRDEPYIRMHKPKAIVVIPLINLGKVTGALYFENRLVEDVFTEERIEVLKLISGQAANALEKSMLYEHVNALKKANERFVPDNFLKYLNRPGIAEVSLGDHVEREMSVMFCNIWDFTILSNDMTPLDIIKFINSYLEKMEPVISDHMGFVDKFIGDQIMALFGKNADYAVQAAIKMLHMLNKYNEDREMAGYKPVTVGIGINTGRLMLGTVGGKNRMETTVISDAVNIASRIETVTRQFNVPLIITQNTMRKLHNPDMFHIRKIGMVTIKGKSDQMVIYEVFDADPFELKNLKIATINTFNEALAAQEHGEYGKAYEIFTEYLKDNPDDHVAQYYHFVANEQLQLVTERMPSKPESYL